jgi:hypothetical protein
MSETRRESASPNTGRVGFAHQDHRPRSDEGTARAQPVFLPPGLRVTAVSVNIHLYLDVDGLASPDEADRVGAAVNLLMKDHGIESWMVVRASHEPPSVTARSEPDAIIVRGFGEWSRQFERDAEQSIRPVAPRARIDLDWDCPDLD